MPSNWRAYIGSGRSEKTAELTYAQTLLCSADIYASLSTRSEETGSVQPAVRIGNNELVRGLSMMVMVDLHTGVTVGKQTNQLFGGEEIQQPQIFLNGVELETAEFYPLRPGAYDLEIHDPKTGKKVNNLLLYVEEEALPDEEGRLEKDFDVHAERRLTDFFTEEPKPEAETAEAAVQDVPVHRNYPVRRTRAGRIAFDDTEEPAPSSEPGPEPVVTVPKPKKAVRRFDGTVEFK
jgi:hypothetical protein